MEKDHSTPSTNTLRFKCGKCEKGFNRKFNMERHMKNHCHNERQKAKNECPKHTEDLAYPCTICSKRFALPNHLHAHLNVHFGEYLPYKCVYCEAGFTNSKKHKGHVRLHRNMALCEVPEDSADYIITDEDIEAKIFEPLVRLTYPDISQYVESTTSEE